MSNVAELFDATSTSTLPHSYLGPANVVATGPIETSLELPDGERVAARLAVAFAYVPEEGDVVLTIGNDGGFYVIGVLSSSGPAVMSFPGDLELRAAGELRLRGEDGVRVDGPSMQVDVGKLELVARSVTQRFQNLRQHVSELWNRRAGQTHTVVEGSSFTRANDATLLTKEKVSINGKSIHLG